MAGPSWSGVARGRGGRLGRRWRLAEDSVVAHALEGVDLKVWLLVGGGDAGVAEQMCHAPERRRTLWRAQGSVVLS